MNGPLTLGWVEEQRSVLAAGVAVLDPDVVLASEAPAMWECFDRIERLAASAKVLLARRVDDSRAWQRHGFRNPIDYVARKAGTSTGRAGLIWNRQRGSGSSRCSRRPAAGATCRRPRSRRCLTRLRLTRGRRGAWWPGPGRPRCLSCGRTAPAPRRPLTLTRTPPTVGSMPDAGCVASPVLTARGA
ncbi:MAG: hypothetical protein WKF43_00235 [Acidimicrobiales bacterium]